MNPVINLDGRLVGPGQPPYIVAEMSNNHLQDLQRALEIIKMAKEAGADAVKIQTYTADSLTIDCDSADFQLDGTLWEGKTYYQLYESIAAPLEWTEELFAYAKQLGITLFSSPFSIKDVDFLEQHGCPFYKIASFEAMDYPFFKRVAQTGKPIIISTGVSELSEILELLQWCEEQDVQDFVLLHCTSAYPATTTDMNIAALYTFARLKCLYGLSDHSLNHIAATTAVALGACLVEKHVTLSRNDGGPDAEFSLEPSELAELCRLSRAVFSALGDEHVLARGKRQGQRHGRSLYCVKDIKAGEPFTADNVAAIRPGHGLHPRYYRQLLGKRASTAVARGTALSWDVVND